MPAATTFAPDARDVPVDMATHHAIAQFLYREARLLDERDWARWDDLFTPDGMYWVPLTHDQQDPVNHASLFYEDAIMRDVRCRRLEEERAWSQQPVTRAARIVGNVFAAAEANGDIVVRSTFQMTEWRKRREQRQLAGHYLHHLVPEGGSWRIRLKRVDLINCDAIHDCFEIFL